MDRKFLSLVSVLFLSTFVLLFSIARETNPFKALNPRAAQEQVVSAENSLMFAWPLVSTAGSDEPVKIDVVVRNDKKKSIPEKMVRLVSSQGTIDADSNSTNKEGRAVFFLTSDSPGVAVVRATVDNVELEQQLSIRFE